MNREAQRDQLITTKNFVRCPVRGRDSKYLYVRNSNQNTISIFQVEDDGGLTRIQDVSSGLLSGGALVTAAR